MRNPLTDYMKKLRCRLPSLLSFFSHAFLASHGKRLLICLLCFLVLSAPLDSQTKKRKKSCRNCFSAQFNNISLEDFLKTMASLVQKNVLLDSSLKGKITIVSHEFIPESRALPFFKQVLAAKGYTLIEEPNLIKVVPIAKGSQENFVNEKKLSSRDTGVVSRYFKVPLEIDMQEISKIMTSIGGKDMKIIPYPATNTLIVSGVARNVLRAFQVARKLIKDTLALAEQDGPARSGIHIYHSRYLAAEDLAKVLTKLDAPKIGGANSNNSNVKSTTNKKIRTVAHKETNSLIFTATAAEWQETLKIIQKLDIPRSQVLLEVMILDVTLNERKDYGINWLRIPPSNAFGTDLSRAQFANPALLAPLTSGGTINVPPLLPGSPVVDTSFSLAQAFALGGNLGVLGAFIRAGVSRDNIRVLSSPQVLALNNQESEIKAGRKISTRTSTTNLGSDNTPTSASYKYVDTGITLKVTPQINQNGQVTMKLFVESSNGLPPVGENLPTIIERSINTQVTIANQQTIVLGGLISKDETKNITKIPFLGDIPLLGLLFRNTSITQTQTNLMIFITPHVLENKDEADRLTQAKLFEVESSQKLHYKKNRLFPIDGPFRK